MDLLPHLKELVFHFWRIRRINKTLHKIEFLKAEIQRIKALK